MVDSIQRLNPAGLNNPSHFGYSQVTVAPAGAAIVYIAGQLGLDENGHLVSDDFVAQLQQAFANLRIALAAAETTPEQVVKITILSVDHNPEKQQLISTERNLMWGSDRKPASTLIPVSRLAIDGALFEIDAVAVISA